MIYEMRPFEGGRWTDPETPANKRRGAHTFRSSWSDTLVLLGDEIAKLGGKSAIVQVDVQGGDIRRDGMLSMRAKVGHRGVVVSFESRHGPLRYACDTYEKWYGFGLQSWQANVRAIVLTLQALRAVDRYGAAARAQQYTGWAQITGTGSTEPPMTVEMARKIIRDVAGVPVDEVEGDRAAVLRLARARAHPDRNNGDRHLWDNVEKAARVLGFAS